MRRLTSCVPVHARAISHLNDEQAIDDILAYNAWAGDDGPSELRIEGIEVGAGGFYAWQPGSGGELDMGAVDGESGHRLLPVLFEGIGQGSGKLIFELMLEDTVLASSSVNLRLRPLDQLYDQFSVAYGPNVDTVTGNFINSASAFAPNAVPTTANLAGENLERGRIQGQSDDYFLYVHGWKMQRSERQAFAESAYKRMYWSGYRGQFGFYDWPTQWTDDPMNDPGNFDRSEYLAWNSADGLLDALYNIRATKMGSAGKLSAMAHSMGNVVLSEALYQAETGPGPLVDTAIMSQAAISSHYYTARTDRLASIYTEPDDIFCSSHIISHTDPSWTEYKSFTTSGTIGGLLPRFVNISRSGTVKILNYYNPDDYALASWKMDQALKPTDIRGLAYLSYAYAYMDFGNVELSGGSFSNYLEFLFGDDAPPGFGSSRYVYEASENRFYREVIHYSVLDDEWVVDSRVPLNLSANEYEMLAFCASSIVAAVGGVDGSNIPGVFSDGVDLTTLAPVFNNKNTGHSAQFIGSYIGTEAYWQALREDIQ